MLHARRIPMTPDEHAAVDNLIASNPLTSRTHEIYKLRRETAEHVGVEPHQLDQHVGDTKREQRVVKKAKNELAKKLDAIDHDGIQVSLTRRDPGDTGPVLVQIHGPDIDELFEIAEDGTTTKIEVDA